MQIQMRLAGLKSGANSLCRSKKDAPSLQKAEKERL